MPLIRSMTDRHDHRADGPANSGRFIGLRLTVLATAFLNLTAGRTYPDALPAPVSAALDICTTPGLTHAERLAKLEAAGANPIPEPDMIFAAAPVIFGSNLADSAGMHLIGESDATVATTLAANPPLSFSMSRLLEAEGSMIVTHLDLLSFGDGVVLLMVTDGQPVTDCSMTLPSATTIADISPPLERYTKTLALEIGDYTVFSSAHSSLPSVDFIIPSEAAATAFGIETPARPFLKTFLVRSKL